jgi:RNA polymerase sigma-70 factor (ECF subfamily)
VREGDPTIGSQPPHRRDALLAHLDAGYNLARWLMRDEQDARDVVHDAFVRALRARGEVEHVKTWFLAIVRNTAFTALRRRPSLDVAPEELVSELPALDADPELRALVTEDLESVRACLMRLPEEQREVFVLREIEELSYQELADLLAVPIGTVMSRLSRARTKLVSMLRSLDVIGGTKHV